MPAYGVAQAGSQSTSPGLNLTAVQPGSSFTLFNNEAVAAGNASVAFCVAPGPSSGAQSGITFQIQWASAPTAEVDIQASMLDVDADYVSVYSSNNKQQDYYGDLGLFIFYRSKVISYSAGGNLTVIAKR